MVVSNLLLWKRDSFNMCLCGTGRGVCYEGHRGFQREDPSSGVFFRQLEAALEFCPERTELGLLSLLSGVGERKPLLENCSVGSSVAKSVEKCPLGS